MISPLDRLEAALAALAATDALTLFSHVAAQEARISAEESARRLAAGKARSPLEGRLIALKGNIAVRGWPWQGGLRARVGVVATDDATVVGLLRAAGAVLLGLTTQDEGALGAEGLALEGPIRHPLDPERSTGGSSGGSAGALAAGLCDFALGSDTIGSLRIPAALCGISALKPSSGRVSVRGVLPVHPRFDHVGPMAHGVGDLSLLLGVIGGHDPSGASSMIHPTDGTVDGTARSARPLEGWRIGYGVGFEDLEPEPAVIRGYDAALTALQAAGAEMLPIDLRPLELRRTRRAVFALCEHEMWKTYHGAMATKPEDWSGRIRALLEYGGSLDATKLGALDARVTAFQSAWAQRVEGLDACVTPTTPRVAFQHGAPPPDNLADLTIIGTAAAVPALSVPCPTVVAEDGTATQDRALPVGLQVLTPHGADARALAVAAALTPRGQ